MSRREDYIWVKSPPCRMLIHKEIASTELGQHICGGSIELSKHYAMEQVEASEAARVYKFSTGSASFYFKQHLLRDIRDRFKFLLRKSRSMRAFEGAMILEENSFNGPEFAAVVERMAGPVCIENYTVTREYAGGVNVRELMHDCAAGKTISASSRRGMIAAFGRLVGKMHAAGICHGDLRLGNVLVRDNGGVYEFAMLDNERTKKYKTLPRKMRIKNLVQINMSREYFTRVDAMKFWKTYTELNSADGCLAEQIDAITSKRLRLKADRRPATKGPDAI
ncbi:MAG: hypothetical protein A2Y07_00775 [Planctomycetes bacterium GWF2_50_10]|nr:MAG: hypothetical protein A2Y07_00775 [Planctomycetes bacterium GWF2_50_10]